MDKYIYSIYIHTIYYIYIYIYFKGWIRNIYGATANYIEFLILILNEAIIRSSEIYFKTDHIIIRNYIYFIINNTKENRWFPEKKNISKYYLKTCL